MLVVDASESLDSHFKKQIDFAIERVLAHINVNPVAVRFGGIDFSVSSTSFRMALITYSGSFFVHFTFNNLRFYNNTAIEEHLRVSIVYELELIRDCFNWG